MNRKNDYSGLDPDTFGEEARGGARTVDNGLAFGPRDAENTVGAYAVKTFGWMFVGVLATFVTAIAFYLTGAWRVLISTPALPFLLAIAEIIVVMVLSARLQKLSVNAARGMFMLYSVLNGLTFASLFALYEVSSLVYVFAISAVYFGVLAAYGALTKRDLTSLRPLLIIGAVVMLIFWVLSMFLPLSGFEKLACFFGLALFMGFTAYDTQKIRAYYNSYGGNPALAKKASIFCALQLYLDFINIFLYVLRLVGRRSD